MVIENEEHTARMNVDEELRKREELFHALLQHSADAIEIVDAQGVILYASAPLEHVLGYLPEECVGTSVFEYIHPDDAAITQGKLTELQQAPGTRVAAEYRVRHKDGSWVWIEVNATNYLHIDSINGIVGAFRDVTRRKETELALEHERERLHLAQRAGHIGIFECDLQNDVIIWTPENEALHGLAPGTFPGNYVAWRTYIYSADLEAIESYLRSTIRSHAHHFSYEMRIIHPDGKLHWLLTQGDIDYDDRWKAKRLIGVNIDITERKQAEEERVRVLERVQASEARLRRLMDSNIIGIIFTDINGTITEANDSFLRVVGYTREDLLQGRINWGAMTPPEYEELDRKAVEEMLRDGVVSNPYEKEYIAKDGRHVPVLVGGAMLDQSSHECVAFIIDIREQKQMAEEIRNAKEQLEVIFHNVADGISVQNHDGRLLYANDVAARMSGFSSAQEMLHATPESMAQTISKFQIKDEDGEPLPLSKLPGRRALRGERDVQRLVQYVNTLTNQIRWSLIKAQPIFDEEGQVVCSVNVITDMTERQELEQRKNEFISMASHELKTPVTSLKGFTNLLQRRCTKQEDQQALHYLARMDAQLNRLTKLISDLLDISKIQAGKFVFQEEAVNLNTLLHETVENVQGATSTHTISIEEESNLWIRGDSDRLGQVFINLLTNAIKYSPSANNVIVRLKRQDDCALVEVQDFGIGIAEAHHQQIFERFYQVTDPEEKTYPGLGIGLYISAEIIKRHRGQIWVESHKGQGASFFCRLPILQLE